MERESIEEMRRRLLKDEQVQMLISMRAYEIYKMRGSQPGQDAEDWFRAENEILTFLIQEETRREAYSHDLGSRDETDARPQAFEPRTTPEAADRLGQTVGQLAQERAESQSALGGVWSPAEPASTELAPPIGKSTEAPAEKMTRSRSTSKSAEPRKRKSTAAKESAENKPTARRTSSKNATEGESKPKTTRRKPATSKTEE